MSWILSDKESFFAFWKLFCNETSGSDIVKSQAHTVFPSFWSGHSPNIAKVSLTASKTELSYYWLSDENMTASSESCVQVVKSFPILKLQLLETD